MNIDRETEEMRYALIRITDYMKLITSEISLLDDKIKEIERHVISNNMVGENLNTY